jgi:hypothetical protein
LPHSKNLCSERPGIPETIIRFRFRTQLFSPQP